MAKKRVVAKRGKAKTKKPVKRDGFDKSVVLNAFVIAAIILLLVLVLNKFGGTVIVKNLKLEEGEKDYIKFDITHTFSKEKECFADIKIYKDNEIVCNTIQELGIIEPNQFVSKSLFMPFPEGETDFNVEISCK